MAIVIFFADEMDKIGAWETFKVNISENYA